MVYAEENSRGDYNEIGVKYFVDAGAATSYLEQVKTIRTNKMIKSYSLEEHTVYPTWRDIPTNKVNRCDENMLNMQKAKHSDFRLGADTLEEKYERYLAQRAAAAT